jgi:hypothetical protein
MRNPVAPYKFKFTPPENPESGSPIVLNVYAEDTSGKAVDNLKLEAFVHPEGTAQDAQAVPMRAIGHGNYQGKVTLGQPGEWDLDFVGERNGERARQRMTLEVSPAHTFSPPPDNDDDP